MIDTETEIRPSTETLDAIVEILGNEAYRFSELVDDMGGSVDRMSTPELRQFALPTRQPPETRHMKMLGISVPRFVIVAWLVQGALVCAALAAIIHFIRKFW